MPRRLKPRRGTMQFWPRKRARRIYPRQRFPQAEAAHGAVAGVLGFAAWKAGMTHVQLVDGHRSSPTYGRIIARPVTVLDAPSLFVCGLRFYSSSNGMKTAGEKWAAVPKGVEIKRKTAPAKKEFSGSYDDVRLLAATQPAKSGMAKRKPDVFELAIGGSKEEKAKLAESLLGKELSARDVFRDGEFVDVCAVTKGHGFTGSVKRFGIRIQTRKDKQMHRHVGSIGSTVPRKVDWRVPQAGQHGFHARTEFSKKLLLVEEDAKRVTPKGGFVGYGLPKSVILVEGSVPGARKRLVRLRKAVRRAGAAPAEIKFISTQSKQGV